MIYEFLTQRASSADNISIWWRHHGGTSCVETTVQRMSLSSGILKISRFKTALLLPIKHCIIYSTVIQAQTVSTSTAIYHHGSKGSRKSCGISGLLVCFTYTKYISTGVQGVQQKWQKMISPVTTCIHQQHIWCISAIKVSYQYTFLLKDFWRK